MKYLLLACGIAVLAPSAHAAYGGRKDEDDDQKQDQQQKAPEEIPDFSNLNEYVYQPKTTLNLGYRNMSGVKATFRGNGIIPIPDTDQLVDPTQVNVGRTYHDGAVGPDGRSLAINNGDGTNTAILAAPDGKTNTYGYADASQVTPDDLMTFHDYSAVIPGVNQNQQGKRNTGIELSVNRDMGSIGKHFAWSIFAGISINDIQAAKIAAARATVTTNDRHLRPLRADADRRRHLLPLNTSVAVNDANGNPVIGTDGTPVTQAVSSSGLIGNVPLARSTSSATDLTSVTNHFKLHGAYMTFRAGPTATYSFNDHLKFNVSFGPALIYAGSTYDATEILTPPTGDPVVIRYLRYPTQKLVPAYYVDATVQYDLTDRTGFYLGGVYQNGGSYLQTAGSVDDGTYTTRVSFSDQNGLRTGLTFKF